MTFLDERIGSFTSAIDRILARPALQQSQIGMAFYDMATQEVIFERAGNNLFAGASTTKLLTCATALWELGQDYRFTTQVVRVGEIDRDGTLEGDLVLIAVGDPNLSGRVNEQDALDFCNHDHSLAGESDKTGVVECDPLLVINALADQIVQAGIRHVRGTVAVDLAFADAGLEYGTGGHISAVAVNDNIVDLTFTGGKSEGDPVSLAISPPTNYIRFVNRLVSATSGAVTHVKLLDRLDDRGHHVVDLVGSVPCGGIVCENYMVPEPATFAATALADALAKRGVKIDRAPDGGVIVCYEHSGIVATHRSPPLREAVKVILKVSQNLHAEMLPRVVEHHRGADFISAGDAFTATHELLASLGLADGGAYQGDGCGTAGLFTPRFMCRFLHSIRCLPFGDAFDAALPILGRDGTLREVQKTAQAAAVGAIRAKTGTMGYVDRITGQEFTTAKALAGYITTARGSKLSFSVFSVNLPMPPSAAGQVLGEIAVTAYEML